MSQTHPFPLSSRFLRLSISPSSSNSTPLTVRKSIQDALAGAFGLTSSGTYIDILWMKEDGSEVVVKVEQGDATKVLTAVAAATTSPRLSLLRESPFLPALLTDNTPL